MANLNLIYLIVGVIVSSLSLVKGVAYPLTDITAEGLSWSSTKTYSYLDLEGAGATPTFTFDKVDYDDPDGVGLSTPAIAITSGEIVQVRVSFYFGLETWNYIKVALSETGTVWEWGKPTAGQDAIVAMTGGGNFQIASRNKIATLDDGSSTYGEAYHYYQFDLSAGWHTLWLFSDAAAGKSTAQLFLGADADVTTATPLASVELLDVFDSSVHSTVVASVNAYSELQEKIQIKNLIVGPPEKKGKKKGKKNGGAAKVKKNGGAANVKKAKGASSRRF